MKPLISVIVPVYNVEKYLNKCVDSIINQTFKEMEIILVDDGSTDSCHQIIDEYAKKDNRVIAIHKKNGGQGSARNVGLDISRGEYIGFVDSDDWIDLNMYEKLYKDITSNNSDISICSRKVFNENSECTGIVNVNTETIKLNEKSIKSYLIGKFLLPHTVSTCNKLYKRINIEKNTLRFKDVNDVGSEDALFNYCLMLNINKISSVRDTYYNGVIRQASTTRVYKFGAMKKTSNLMESMRIYSEKINKGEIWNRVEPILFQFYQQWNIDLIKKYSNEDTGKIISRELESASKNEIFKKCEKRMAFGLEHIGDLKKCGYKFTGRLYIRMFMFLSYINQYNLAGKLRSYK